MRMCGLAVAALWLSSSLGSASLAGQAARSGFSLRVEAPSGEVPFEGPIALGIRVTYEGEGSVEVDSLHERMRHIAIEAPREWVRRPRRGSGVIVGPFSFDTLHKGESTSRVLYLHQLYSKLAPGEARLRVTVKVWPERGEAKQPVALRQEVVLQVREPDPKGLEARIHGIAAQIAREQSASKRSELYRSLEYVSDTAAVPVLLQALRDPGVLLFHRRARYRVCELCDATGNWEPVLDHLLQSGRQADKLFFRHWQKRGIRLEPDTMEKLKAAPSLWIRLYAISMEGRTPQDQGLIHSLEAEAKELLEEIRALKEQRARP